MREISRLGTVGGSRRRFLREAQASADGAPEPASDIVAAVASDAASAISGARESSVHNEVASDAKTMSDLGARIREARKAKKMTLRVVAEQVGCSPSMLSKIETDQATPSLRTLHRIAAVLDTSIIHLFGSDAHSEEITVIRRDQRPAVRVRRDDGASILLERLSPSMPDLMLAANIHTLEPGADSGGDIQHAGQEVGYVLQGKAELVVADNVHVLETGDSFYFSSNLPHRYRNLDEGVTRILWVATPATF
ncbi:cupin domain-containing protein [Breoghania sp.]|uniref:cupin domain-containing protein n=1 Tax=Breoghania sp. TaxID=2065378 RepID=UPI002AA707CD|nr:cupin domain-containing protein [Breoghania sp.]